MNKLKIVLVSSLLIAVYFSCNKSELNTINVTATSQADIKISKDWMEQKKAVLTNTASIDSIATSLDWTSASKIAFGINEYLIVIPMGSNVTYNHVAEINKVMNRQQGSPKFFALVLIKDKTGHIRKGNIVEISGNNQPGDKVSLIQNVYYDKPTNFTGDFILMTINKDFIYRLNYRDGKKQSYNARIAANNLKPSTNNATQSTDGTHKAVLTFINTECTDWYWTTTVYDANGNIMSYSEQYLYTTCNTGGGDGGSGDGSTSTDYNNFTLDKITDSLKTPCLDSAKSRITDSNYHSEIQTAMQNHYGGTGTLANLNFREDSTIVDNNGDPLLARSYNDNVTSTWVVVLNPKFANRCSQEMIFEAIIHEINHSMAVAYYNRTQDPNVRTAFQQHMFMMVNSTDDCVSLLKKAFGLSTKDATALALSGYSDLWDNQQVASYMSTTFNISYNDMFTISNNYLEGISGNVCH